MLIPPPLPLGDAGRPAPPAAGSARRSGGRLLGGRLPGWGRLESALPNVAGGLGVAVVALGMGHQELSHPAPEVVLGTGPEHQVEIVRHQAVAEDVRSNTSISLDTSCSRAVR